MNFRMGRIIRDGISPCAMNRKFEETHAFPFVTPGLVSGTFNFRTLRPGVYNRTYLQNNE
jgi:hypothetical protein